MQSINMPIFSGRIFLYGILINLLLPLQAEEIPSSPTPAIFAKEIEEEIPKPPKASIKISDSKGSAPFKTTFNASGSKGEDLSYIWNFGDGSPLSTESFVDHLFVMPGEYTIRLTVEDAYGRIAFAEKTITAKEDYEPFTVTQFRFSEDYFGFHDPAAYISFRLWDIDLDLDSILTIKIGGNVFGYLPGQHFESEDPLIILGSTGEYVGEAENALQVRLQKKPTGEIRGIITADFLEDVLDQRTDFKKTRGIGNTTFTIFSLKPSGEYKVYRTNFYYIFSVKRRRFDGEADDASIHGRLTDHDPVAEKGLPREDKLKLREQRKKEKERIRKEIRKAQASVRRARLRSSSKAIKPDDDEF